MATGELGATRGLNLVDGLRGLFVVDRIVLVLVALIVGALAVLPLFFLVWNAFKPVGLGQVSDFSLQNWTLVNFIQAYSSPRAIVMLGNSFFFAAGSMVVAFFFGGALAFLVERTNVPFRNVIYAAMFIPLAIPSLLKAFGWIMLLSPRIGMLNHAWFQLGFTEPLFTAYSIPAMFWVEGISMAPLTFLLLGAALRAMDPALEEAAYTSGANSLQTGLRITMRLMWPALAGIALLQFVRGIEAFEVPLIMGFSQGILVFSTNIYLALRETSPPQYGIGFAYSLTLVAIALVGVILYQKALNKYERYATITGKGFRPRLIDLGRWKIVAAALVFFFVMVGIVLPLFALFWSSLLRFYQPPSLQSLQAVSFENYRFVFAQSNFLLSVKNTLIVSGTVAIAGMLLATAVSWMVLRVRTPGTKILDYLVFSSFAVPSVAMAFAFLIVFLSFPNPIYGTIWIIAIAYTANFLPIATRFTHAGVAQLGKELEEAASVSGASLLGVLRRVTVPLILPSLVGGGLFIFLLSAKVPSMALILYNPQTMVLPVWIFKLWDEGTLGEGSALAVLMIAFLIVVIVAGRSFIQRRSYVER